MLDCIAYEQDYPESVFDTFDCILAGCYGVFYAGGYCG